MNGPLLFETDPNQVAVQVLTKNENETSMPDLAAVDDQSGQSSFTCDTLSPHEDDCPREKLMKEEPVVVNAEVEEEQEVQDHIDGDNVDEDEQKANQSMLLLGINYLDQVEPQLASEIAASLDLDDSVLAQNPFVPLTITFDSTHESESLAESLVTSDSNRRWKPASSVAPLPPVISDEELLMECARSLERRDDQRSATSSDPSEAAKIRKRMAVVSLKTYGDAAFNSGDLKRAKKHYFDALDILEMMMRTSKVTDESGSSSVVSDNSALTAKLYVMDKYTFSGLHCSLGHLYRAIDKSRRAKEHFHQSLKAQMDIIERLSANNQDCELHVVALENIANKIGNTFFRSQEFASALEFYKVATENKFFPLEPVGISRSFDSDDEEAPIPEYFYSEAEDPDQLIKRLLIARSDSLNNTANVYNVTEKYFKAIRLYNQALQIQKDIWGKNDPVVLVTLHNIASCYCREGKHDLALVTYEKVVAYSQYQADNETGALPRTAIDAMAGIAVAMHSLGDVEGSILAYNNALTEGIKSYGELHLKIAGIENAVGELELERGRNVEALSHFHKSYNIYLRNGKTKQDPSMKRCRNNCKAMGFDPDFGVPKRRFDFFSMLWC